MIVGIANVIHYCSIDFMIDTIILVLSFKFDSSGYFPVQGITMYIDVFIHMIVGITFFMILLLLKL